MNFTLHHGDCLEIMKIIPDGSVDMILCDLPYGTTACKWDNVIPFEPLWRHYWRVLKPNGAVVLFGSEPFSSALRFSQIEFFKYDWIWHKSKCGSGFTAKSKPLLKHETLSVFSRCAGKIGVNYFPQMSEGKPYSRTRQPHKKNNHKIGFAQSVRTENKGERYPETVIYFQQKWRRQDQIHPTQKPVPLLEYLIKTYTLEGETVLDNTMGSGSTGVAALNTNRKFIGIEQEAKYFDIAQKRIAEAADFKKRNTE